MVSENPLRRPRSLTARLAAAHPHPGPAPQRQVPSPASSPHFPALSPRSRRPRLPGPQPEVSARTHSGRTPVPARWPTWPTRSAPWWRRRPRLGGIPGTLRLAPPPPAPPEAGPAPARQPRPQWPAPPRRGGRAALSVKAGPERGVPCPPRTSLPDGVPCRPSQPPPGPGPDPLPPPGSFRAGGGGHRPSPWLCAGPAGSAALSKHHPGCLGPA